MFDFFDEDFPLTKKQEGEYNKRLAEEAEKASEEEKTGDIDLEGVTVDEPAAEEFAEEADEAETLGQVEEPEQAEQAAPQIEPEETAQVEDIAEESAEEAAEEHSEQEISVEERYAQEIERIMNGAEKIAAEESPAEESPAEEIAEETAEESSGEISESDITDDEPDDGYEAEENDEPVHEMPSGESEPMPDISEKIASLDEIEAHLHEELKNLGEKLDSMERTVDNLEDGELSEGFSYAYDGRYYAEEETPAYKHPEIYGRKQPSEKKYLPVKVTEKKVGASVSKQNLIGLGVAAAAAALALGLLRLGGKKK